MAQQRVPSLKPHSDHQRNSLQDMDVRYVRGVGPRRAALLSQLGIKTVRDLLLHLPRGYEDTRMAVPIAHVREGEKALVCGTVTYTRFRPIRSRVRGILEVTIEDTTGEMTLIWFNATPAWVTPFPVGERVIAYGEVRYFGGPQMVSPQYEAGKELAESRKFGKILPVYPLTKGISQGMLRSITTAALEYAPTATEVIPPTVRKERSLPDIVTALRDAHFPAELSAAQRALRRHAYEEVFVFQTALALRRAAVRSAPGISFKIGPTVDRRIRSLFPFEFTEAQNRVVAEVADDMRQPRPMNRLLQGDVGSGKTVVAIYAMLAALAESSKGYQAALMAPTEILAEQHYLSLRSLLQRARVRTALITGSCPAAERERNLHRLARGEIDLVVGTHALVQPDVQFANLGLIVIDEQHRFGVRHRLALRAKGPQPDVLIMTATPIPRTLALVCLSDMDVSVIDQMPPGRAGVDTSLLPTSKADVAFRAALEELRAGRRVYVIYPLVEDTAQTDLTSATKGYCELSEGVFSEFRCCLMHGQLPAQAKQEAMEGFRAGRYQVMVATTVVEVGIDVPEATVMIVQHADRLGLAQLHQLRGRIGRGTLPATCYLLADPQTEEARRRLEVLVQTNDGFRIAEEDLRMRGPGQLFGTEQSGAPEFRCYDFSDLELLREARDDAFHLVAQDPTMARPEHAALRRRVMEQYGRRLALADVA